MKLLIVGDVTDYLATYATKKDKSAKLVTQDSVDSYLASPTGTFYTSLGDFTSPDRFCDALLGASQIEYKPPQGQWSDKDLIKDSQFSMETEIKEHLYQWGYLHRRSVIGLSLPDFYDPTFNNTIVNHARQTDEKQAWNFGCSITAGVGVAIEETYGDLVCAQLGLPLTRVAYRGSSVKWAADQIIASDIRPRDIVIWGVTSFNRFGYFLHDGRFYHLTSGFTSNYPLFNKLLPRDWLISPHVIYESLRGIQIADNFCRKIGAHLIMLGVFESYPNKTDLQKYPNFISIGKSFADKGTDKLHPGPKHHQIYAKAVLEYIERAKVHDR